MNGKRINIIICIVSLLAGFTACGQKTDTKNKQESREAKQLLQGVWMDEETESVAFRMKGDTVYYADSTSVPAYFKVVDDTLYLGSVGNHIEKHMEHVLWIKNQNNEVLKFVKTDEENPDIMFKQKNTEVQTLTEVLKRDTVVFYNGMRYHCYIAINPTKYKVTRQAVNDDGLVVDNVYYDNIIHVSIFNGNQQLFSSDMRKNIYEKSLPQAFLQQAIFNDMTFNKVDDQGFHFDASLCIPEEASCYLIDQVISFSGKTSSRLLEY